MSDTTTVKTVSVQVVIGKIGGMDPMKGTWWVDNGGTPEGYAWLLGEISTELAALGVDYPVYLDLLTESFRPLEAGALPNRGHWVAVRVPGGSEEAPRRMPEWGREFGAEYAVPEWVMVAGVTDRSWHNDACPSFTVDRWGDDPGSEYAGRPTLWVEHVDPTKREEGVQCRFSLAVADHRHETEVVLETNRTDLAQAVWHWVAVQAMVSPVGVEQVRRVAREITHRLVREAVESSPEAKRLVNAISALRGKFGYWHLDDNPSEVRWTGVNTPRENDVRTIADTMAQARAEFGRLFPREAAITGDWGLWLVAKVYGF